MERKIIRVAGIALIAVLIFFLGFLFGWAYPEKEHIEEKTIPQKIENKEIPRGELRFFINYKNGEIELKQFGGYWDTAFDNGIFELWETLKSFDSLTKAKEYAYNQAESIIKYEDEIERSRRRSKIIDRMWINLDRN